MAESISTYSWYMIIIIMVLLLNYIFLYCHICHRLQLDSLGGQWTALPPMPSPRCLFSMGEFENLIFAIAGKDLQSDESVDTVMCYDTE